MAGARILALVIGFVPLVAVAGDGVVEINHACASQGGCFPGDTSGYPVTIDGSAGRSYRLTGDLILADQNTTGILISTPDVGIDLNQFSIIAAACVGVSSSCAPAFGSGRGVAVTSTSTIRGVAVHDGSIVGAGAFGVYLGPQAEVRNLRARWNRLDGIVVFDGSMVSGSSAYQNGREGISAAGIGTMISQNTAFNNGGVGIFANDGSTVSGNTVYDSGGHGIVTNEGCSVRGNTVRNNGGFGMQLGPHSGYLENVINGNAAGQVRDEEGFDLFVNLGQNSCTSGSCP